MGVRISGVSARSDQDLDAPLTDGSDARRERLVRLNVGKSERDLHPTLE